MLAALHCASSATESGVTAGTGHACSSAAEAATREAICCGESRSVGTLRHDLHESKHEELVHMDNGLWDINWMHLYLTSSEEGFVHGQCRFHVLLGAKLNVGKTLGMSVSLIA